MSTKNFNQYQDIVTKNNHLSGEEDSIQQACGIHLFFSYLIILVTVYFFQEQLEGARKLKVVSGS